MTTLKDAMEAAGRALFEEAARQAKDPARLASGVNRARAVLLAFLSHPAVREPSGAFGAPLDRGSVAIKAADGVRHLEASERMSAAKAAWQAMLNQLVKELRDV